MDLLHQHGAIWKLLIATIVLGSSGRRPDEVHLIVLRIEDRPTTEHLIHIAIISRLADVSRLVDERESVERLLALRVGHSECSENGQRKDKYECAIHLCNVSFFLCFQILRCHLLMTSTKTRCHDLDRYHLVGDRVRS